MRCIVLALLSLLVLPMSVAADEQPAQDLENTLYMDLKDGRVVIKMYPAFAPQHVARIKELTRAGYYDGSPFHRVIDGFMAQTGMSKDGDPDGSGLADLSDEFNIKKHWRGIASMANTGAPNSANSQFFIMLQDNRQLDGHYTAWGRVRSGMRFIDNIKKGVEELDGAIEGEPDRIIRMQVAADVEGVSTPTDEAAPEVGALTESQDTDVEESAQE